MRNKVLVVIDIQNDITKHYRDIIDRLNAAIDWAVQQGMDVVYIKHNNLSPGTRTFKPDTKGEELVPELKIVSGNIFTKSKANALTSERFSAYIRENGIDEFLHHRSGRDRLREIHLLQLDESRFPRPCHF